jgi:omega-hydroxy-beta-dihydromenaquinone-9 sulfotransferase
VTERSVERPIFVIGCGRSGTTLLYRILCGHRSLAWFSNYTDHWPGLPQLAALSRVYPWMRRRKLAVPNAPIPSEGHRIFDYCSSRASIDNNKPLVETDVTSIERRCLHRVIELHQRFAGGRRFINKNTRNTRRVRFLHELFPDAVFVHVIRDPRATVSSLLRVAFWPDLRFWWRGNRTATQLGTEGVKSVTLAAELWARDVGAALQDSTTLDSSAYIQLRYEELVANPRAEVERVLTFAGVDWDSSFESVFRSFDIMDRAFGYKNHLGDDEIKLIDEVARPVTSALAYLGA